LKGLNQRTPKGSERPIVNHTPFPSSLRIYTISPRFYHPAVLHAPDFAQVHGSASAWLSHFPRRLEITYREHGLLHSSPWCSRLGRQVGMVGTCYDCGCSLEVGDHMWPLHAAVG
jgi:hypothetical protein